MKYRSYSQCELIHQCPRAFKLKYIDKVQQEDNPWSILGSFCHEVVEKIGKKEIRPGEEALMYVIRNYPKTRFIVFGKDKTDEMREMVKRFFFKFRGPTGNVLGIERKFKLQVSADEVLVGLIDLESEKGPNSVIIDYKISTPYKGRQLEEKLRQQYIYSKAFQEEYGKFPSLIGFMYFKTAEAHVFEFSFQAYLEAMSWMRSSLDEIKRREESMEFEPRPDEFYCKNLCGSRKFCEHGG